MGTTVKMGQVSARGGYNLFLGLTFSLIVSSVGMILTARLLAPSEYGIVAITWIIPNFASLFRDWGVTSAMTKYIAQYRFENNPQRVGRIINDGLLFLIFLGLIVSVITFASSGILANVVLHRPEMKPLLEIASIGVFANGVLSGAQAVFTGFERMELNSITMICQSIFGAILCPLLVTLGYGPKGAVIGMTAAILVSSCLGFALVHSEFKVLPFFWQSGSLRVTSTLKGMLQYGLPLSASTMLTGFSGQFYMLLVAVHVTDVLMGNYQVALTMLLLISFFANPINTVLLPAFSKLDAKTNKEHPRSMFQFSVKMTSLVIVPAAIVTMVLAQPMIGILFGGSYADSSLYLSLLAIGQIMSAVGMISIGSLLKGLGRTREFLGLILTTVAVGIPLSIVLVPAYGIVGLIIAQTAAGVPFLVAGLWYVKRRYSITLDWRSTSRIILSSLVAGLAAYTPVLLFPEAFAVQLVLGAGLFFGLYIALVPLSGAVNSGDTRILAEISRGLGHASILANPILRVFEAMTAFVDSSRRRS